MAFDFTAEAEKFTVVIGSESVQVDMTASVKDTLKKLVEDRKWSGSEIFIRIDGREVMSATDLPATFEDCDTVEVSRNVKAGQ